MNSYDMRLNGLKCTANLKSKPHKQKRPPPSTKCF